MSYVYPRALEAAPAVAPFDKVACAAKIVERREADKEETFEQAIGHCLGVAGGTPADVKKVWDEVEEDRVKFRTISPAGFNTLTEYKTGLGMIAKHLDPTDWYNGLKLEVGVSTWAALQSWFVDQQATTEMTIPE